MFVKPDVVVVDNCLPPEGALGEKIPVTKEQIRRFSNDTHKLKEEKWITGQKR